MARGEVRYRITADSKPFTDAAKAAENSFSKLTGRVAGAVAGFVSVGAAVKIATDALKAQAAQEEAINKLNLALANQGKYSEATSRRLVEYSAALQDASVFADEVILGGEALLASFGMNEEQIKKTTQAALDFSAATGTDLNASFQLLGRAFAGNTQSLTRYGIVVDEGLDKTKKFDAVVDQLAGRFGGSALAQTQTYSGGVAQLQNAIGDAQEGLGKFLGELTGGQAPFSAAIGWTKQLTGFLGGDLVQALALARASFLRLLATIVENVSESKLGRAAVTVAGRIADPLNLTGINDTLKDLIDGGKGAAESMRKTADAIELEGAQAAAAAGKTLAFSNALGGSGGGLGDAADRAAKKVQLMNQHVEDYLDMLHGIDQVVMLSPMGMDVPVRNLGDLGRFVGGQGGGQRSHHYDLNPITLAWNDQTGYASAGEKAATSWREGFSSALKDLPDVIQRALQGGGAVGKSIGALFGSKLFGENSGLTQMLTGGLSKGLGKLFGGLGGKVGGLLGSAIPGLGTIVGSIGGDLVGKLFGGLFGGEGKKVNRMRDEYVAAAGGIEELARKAAAAGTNLDAFLKADKVKEFEAAVRALGGAFDEHARGVALQAEAQQKLQEATERYGFTIEELGPAWKRQELDKMAAQLYQDYELLNASNIENETVLRRMGPALNEYIQTVVRAGGEVPAAMKPMIDKALEMGLITDENGKAFETAEEAGITYAETMSEMFKTMIEEVRELVAAIRGVPTDNTINWRHVHHGNPPGGPPTGYNEDGTPDRDGDPYTSAATGFFSPALQSDRYFKAHAGERVEITPAGQTAARNAMDGGPQQITIPVILGGHLLDEVIMRRIRGGYIRMAT